MSVRDKLNTKEKYIEIVEQQKKYIEEWVEKIKSLEEADKKDIQLFKLPNREVIQNVCGDILTYKIDNLIAMYSSGENIGKIKEEYSQVVIAMVCGWDLYKRYIDMVWMLSIGIMLEIENEAFLKLVKLVEKDNPNDFLIDFLISYRIPLWQGKSNEFKFKRPYQAIQEIISFAQTGKIKSLDRLKKYITKEWYRGHSDTGWHDAHKSEWNIHTGYWSFESGALVKILGLDDTTLKGLPYYPHDMVHWSDEKSAPSKRPWTILD